MVTVLKQTLVLLCIILCAQGAVAETLPAVVLNRAISEKAPLEDVAWSDEFAAGSDVDDIVLRYCTSVLVDTVVGNRLASESSMRHLEDDIVLRYCSSVLVDTVVGDRLASESTMQHLGDLVVRACSKSQTGTDETYKFVMFTLQTTQYFFTTELPRLLCSSVVTCYKFGKFTLRQTRYFFAYELPRLLRLLIVTCLLYCVLFLLNVFIGEVMEERKKSRLRATICC